jgi:GDP-4-dehydro-6-deoxy-D-mannose reductase
VTALKVNTLGTHHLLEAVRHVIPKTLVVITSSAAVYKSSTDALSEDSAIGPVSPYGVSKLGQEMVGGAAETPVVVARSFNHAGPRQTPAYVTSSFARQIASIEAGLTEPRLSVGNLDARRDITDVRDTVRAYRAMAARGQAGRPYNVCSGRAYRIGDLLDTMLGRASKAIQVVTDSTRLRPSDQPLILGNPARAAEELDWRATIPIEDTLQAILDFWRQHLATARR